MKNLLLILTMLFFLSCEETTVTPEHTLDDNLIAYYPFNDNTYDESGNDNHGIAHGRISSIDDRYGVENGAYRLDDAEITTTFKGVSGDRDRTISFWAKLDQSDAWLFIDYGSLDHGKLFRIILWPSGDEALIETYRSCVGYGANIDHDTWHHYVYMYSKDFGGTVSSVRIYQDGRLLVSKISDWDSDLYHIDTGDEDPLTIHGSGSIDELRFYDRTLTIDEIEYVMNLK